MKHRGTIRLLTAAVMLCLAAVAPPAAFAQGCAMCRTGADALGADGGKTLNLAILVLVVPTLTLFVSVFVFALRRRNREMETELPPKPPHPAARTETVLHVTWLDGPGSSRPHPS